MPGLKFMPNSPTLLQTMLLLFNLRSKCLKKMDGKGVDISSLKDLLTSFFELVTSYDQAQSTLSDEVVDVEKPESFLNAKEHLDLVLTEKGEKVEKFSATSQSLNEAKEKVNQLSALRDVAKNEVEEIESRVSSAEEEYRGYSDVSLGTVDDLADMEMKKQHLEATLSLYRVFYLPFFNFF
ncbi:hypothetical protein A4A49_59362 [Nicotiana attenuata]|uniref:Uncharacterized protein n=1 Tax=Nicotiana attenuata TaxID=49451 RepID=A0A1J6L4A0_NICAT|nr:hypothetical protein A4A49_59362 [Nicotiana attenuata]